MPYFPIMLDLAGAVCVVVGGGRVAQRRVQALRDCGARVRVVAPVVEPGIEVSCVQLIQRAYQPGDLAGARLVVIATDQPAVNERIAADARTLGVLINRCDEPGSGDFEVPAHAHHGSVTIAVHTGGVSAAASAAIRRELSASLDPDWPRLLEIIAPFRSRIRAAVTDTAQRQQLLARLGGTDALTLLKQQGPEALQRYCEAQLNAATQSGRA